MSIHCPDGCSCSSQFCVEKVHIFSNLSTRQMERITQLIRKAEYRRGDRVFSYGDKADSLYIINKGSLKAYTHTKDGREQILHILREGDFLGDLNLFKKGVWEYYGDVLEDTHICMLHKEDFDGILYENPEIMAKTLEYACERILSLERLVQTLTTRDVDARLAAFLVSMGENFGLRGGKGIEITFPLSREDIANYLGLTRETISRRLGFLQEENLIEITGTRRILLRDMEGLKDLR